MTHTSHAKKMAAVSLLTALPLFSACTTKDANNTHAGGQTLDAGDMLQDSGMEGSPDTGSPSGDDAGQDAQAPATGDGDAGADGGCTGDACAPKDSLAPFALDCATLPENRACQGGPHEVLLVMEEYGLIAMFEPSDGHFLGYFKRPSESYYLHGNENYTFATQGPDQCIWTVSSDDGIQRWNPDGTAIKGKALEDYYLPVPGAADELAVQSPTALAFTQNRVYVAGEGSPDTRVTRWTVGGKFDSVVMTGGDIQSMVVLGDGTLLISDDDQSRVARVDANGVQTPVLGGIDWPAQISYAGNGKLLAAERTIGGAMYEINIATGMAKTVHPFWPPTASASNSEGIAPLENGKWLLTGGEYYVSVLDPASKNPSGQHEQVWNDSAPDSVNFKQVGRACLSESFLASRAPKPANDTCIDPPAGPAIFSEDFEGTGDFTGTGVDRHYNAIYDRGATGFTSTLEAGPGTNTSRVLKLSGAGTLRNGDQTAKTGVYASFADSHPTYIRHRVYVAQALKDTLARFILQNSTADKDQSDWLAGSYIYNGYARAMNSNGGTDGTVEGKWVTIEMRNIDWSARTYDMYVDCKRVVEAVNLPLGLGDSMDLFDLDNYSDSATQNTVAWVDDILIK